MTEFEKDIETLKNLAKDYERAVCKICNLQVTDPFFERMIAWKDRAKPALENFVNEFCSKYPQFSKESVNNFVGRVEENESLIIDYEEHIKSCNDRINNLTLKLT